MIRPTIWGSITLDDNLRTQLQFESNKKSTGVSYLLWFFLGSFGAHRFYLGRTGTAVAQLLLLLLGWLPFFLGYVVLGIWVLVDAFLIPGMIREENQKLINQLDGGGRLTA
ncbi:TM2 domain-containing protein [Qipengyuania gelatinilytica]|uniref:TM2 domain-containing protein n=1 Tax=Qipengyuania gelatinilytica TaxID=2867231 RepID=A0ABX9A4Q7_9SPHN|nr:TM2 domain-containing protein [Qipengyuania gelatinilytica]